MLAVCFVGSCSSTKPPTATVGDGDPRAQQLSQEAAHEPASSTRVVHPPTSTVDPSVAEPPTTAVSSPEVVAAAQPPTSVSRDVNDVHLELRVAAVTGQEGHCVHVELDASSSSPRSFLQGSKNGLTIAGVHLHAGKRVWFGDRIDVMDWVRSSELTIQPLTQSREVPSGVNYPCIADGELHFNVTTEVVDNLNHIHTGVRMDRVHLLLPKDGKPILHVSSCGKRGNLCARIPW